MNNIYPVIVAGMPRSGSTMLYNMVMNICKHDKSGKQYEFYKFHNFYEHNFAPLRKNINTKIITHIRDIRDTIASHKRRSVLDRCIAYNKHISWFVGWHMRPYKDWRDLSQYQFVYENYTDRPQENKINMILEISNFLNIELTLSESKNILDYLENNLKNNIDLPEITMMSPNHITNGGKVGSFKDTLSEYEIKFIETKCHDWLLRHRYKLCF